MERERPGSRHAELARAGLEKIESAILALLADNIGGLTNAQIARELQLQTGLNTGQKNYLTWSILKEMALNKRVSTVPKQDSKPGVLYVLPAA